MIYLDKKSKMSRLHNWYLHIDNGKLLLNYATPTDGGNKPESSGIVRQGRGSESGNRSMNYVNSYNVKTNIEVDDARSVDNDFEFLINDNWRLAPWANRFNNKNFPHHKVNNDVINIIGIAKKLKYI